MTGVGMSDLDGRTLDEFRQRGIASDRLPSDALTESDGNLIEMLHLREGAICDARRSYSSTPTRRASSPAHL